MEQAKLEARQQFFRDMYRTGNLSPYQRERPGIDLKKVGEAWNDPETQGVKSRIMAVDLALRGGADKEYNKLGDLNRRLQRMGVMGANLVPYFVFDVVTSIPAGLITEYLDLSKDVRSKRSDVPTAEQIKADKWADAAWNGLKKNIDVLNDKVVTALGDIMVTKLTGEKGGWTHEAADKSADLLQTAMDDYVKDAVNGPVLESVMRTMFQVPVVGAVIEQGWTRLSLLQEKSQLNKGIAKAFYMGIGYAIGVYRDVKSVPHEKKYAPSTRLSRGFWKLIEPRFRQADQAA